MMNKFRILNTCNPFPIKNGDFVVLLVWNFPSFLFFRFYGLAIFLAMFYFDGRATLLKFSLLFLLEGAERMRTDQSGGPLDGDDKNGQLVIHAAVTAKGNNNNNIGPT
jgi:hypothetical protein